MQQLSRRMFVHNSLTPFVCRSCRLARLRQYSTATSSSSPAGKSHVPPKPPVSGVAPLSTRQLLSIDGVDSAKFLQGLVSGNITANDGQPRRDAFYTGFMNATGRVMHDVLIYPRHTTTDEPSFLIEADTAQIDRLAKYVKKYKLRAKVTIRKISPDEVSVWQAWDDSGNSNLPSSSDSSLVILDPRLSKLGYRILQFKNAPPSIDLETAPEDAYTIRRYLNGVPEGQDEILREHALPLESNMELMNGIDFHKGCYVGQELTIRTKHRGVVRKRILPVVIYEKDKAAPTSLSYDPESVINSPENLTAGMIPGETSIGRFGKKGRSAGKWLTGVGNIGLGLCRLEMMTDVVLPGEQDSSASKTDAEFAVEWGGEDEKSMLKVKAFVPDWVRDGIQSNNQH